jgi:predicted nucleic acid-binding protein
MLDKVLIDTSVWVDFFREKNSGVSLKVREYLRLNRVCYVGLIAVELYQGAKTEKEIHVIDQLLEAIDYVEIDQKHYFHAGQISQKAARKGKTFSTVDMIIATLAKDENLTIFSLDHHFREIAQYLDLSLVASV